MSEEIQKTPIIAIANQKGGCGKTITSLNLAYAFAKIGLSVLLVDADKQQGSMKWYDRRVAASAAANEEVESSGKAYKGPEELPFAMISMFQPVLHKQLPAMAVNYDLVIIDGTPRTDELSRSIVLAADVVLVPMQPNGADLDGTDEFMDIIINKTTINPNFRSAFFFTRFKPRTKLAKTSNEIANLFPDVPLLPAKVEDRVSYQNAHTDALVVGEQKGRDRDSFAAEEMKHLAKIVTQFVGGELDEQFEQERETILSSMEEVA